MKTTVASIACMMLIARSLAQGASGSPMAAGLGLQPLASPNIVRHPHIHHLQPPPISIPNNQGFPSCSDVESIGSPILMTYQAEELIENAMKMQAQGTFVRFIFSKQESGALSFSKIYKIIFEIRDQSQANYVGLLLDSPTNGIGSTKFVKFILNGNLEIVRKVLKITDPMPQLAYTCGDLKMIFSSFGNDPRSSVPSNYPGFNRNGVPPAILKALQDLIKVGSSTPSTPGTTPPGSVNRDCSVSHFVKSTAYYTPNNSQLSNGSVPDNRNPFTEVRCNPTGDQIMKNLSILCRYYTGGPNNGQGEVYAVQGTFFVPFTQNIETTNFIGLESPPPAANTAVTTWNIDLTAATRIETYYPLGSAQWYGIVVVYSNGTKNQLVCGTDGTIPVTAGQQLRDSIEVKNLIGFWGGKNGNLENANGPLDFFGFMKYA